jgi:23S rRNA (uracil1939-C5)-methyltransferase
VADDTFELELTAMAHGGSALGRHVKQTIFVPYTIPGERILARIIQDKGRIAFAEGVQLIEASADRVFPRCPHFGPGRCGLCHWQHIDYAAQLLLKQDVLADQLARVGDFDDATIEAAVKPVIPSPSQWGYNYHMTFETRLSDSNSPPFLGFPSADGRGIVGINECHVLHPDLLALYDTLDLDFGGARRVKLQLGTDGAHMIILTMNSEDAPELEIDLPTSVNILLPDNEPVNLIGESNSRYQLGERTFRITAGGYFRANVAQLDTLAATVIGGLELSGSEKVLDLYAGVGFFSAFLAERCQLVTMIESYPPAVTDAETNLSEFDNIDIIEGSVEDVLPMLEDRYDAAVLDPPPDGLSVEVMDTLAKTKVQRLVYVSSDAATLARDGKRLTQQGYRLMNAQPIDLAPQTYHIDTVATFVR